MLYNWLFVVQNFELKKYEDSAAKTEVVEPILKSNYVKKHKVLCFDRSYDDFYATVISENFARITSLVLRKPVVIYGAGIHTQQHFFLFKRLNVQAITDRDQTLWGSYIEGILIISPDNIFKFAEHVVISSKAYEEAIDEELRQRYPMLTTHKLYSPSSEDEKFNLHMKNSILEELSDSPPDILFYCPTHPLDCLPLENWEEIKLSAPNTKFITLWWDYDEEGENSPYLKFEKDCLQWNDICIDNSNSTRINKMKQGLFPYNHHSHIYKVIFHPTIFDPELFYPEDRNIKKYDIALFGSPAGNRKQWISYLKAEFKERFHHIGGVKYGEEMLSIKDYARALRETKICINTQTYPFREQCKGKVREALACGVLLLEEDNKQTRALLNEGEGILYFDSQQTLLNLINDLLHNEYKRRDYEDKGQAVWTEIGTPNKWVEVLLKKLHLLR